jgi:hypothetical protein
MRSKESTAPTLPSAETIRDHMLNSLCRYWPNDSNPIASLPIIRRRLAEPIIGPLRLKAVRLPDWAADCGKDGVLLVPREAAIQNLPNLEPWQQTDWWLSAFLMIEGWHERVWEHAHGPIHSYSFRLKGWDERAWQYAWVNRIALFLRHWATQLTGGRAIDQMGPLPKACIRMTHDVDAVAKTFPIRFKQGSFNLFNAAHSFSRGQFRQTVARLKQAGRFVLGQENWWTFDQLQEWEADVGIQAIYNFYADKQRKSLNRWLFDPGYDIDAPKQRLLLRQLISRGHSIGLHPGFETWRNPEQIRAQRGWIEEAAGSQVTHCRQHWLRFSWQDTWSAQQQAGLALDTTLMFNDRPGFRNSSALGWQPYSPHQLGTHDFRALPTLFMDSHFYDYQLLSTSARRSAMRHWIQECQAVSGEAAVLWHPHTLTQDYGWCDGLQDAIDLITGRNLCR